MGGLLQLSRSCLLQKLTLVNSSKGFHNLTLRHHGQDSACRFNTKFSPTPRFMLGDVNNPIRQFHLNAARFEPADKKKGDSGGKATNKLSADEKYWYSAFAIVLLIKFAQNGF